VFGLFYFFFQAEDGIRGFHVTGVQTCALPICLGVDGKSLDARSVDSLQTGDAPGIQAFAIDSETGTLSPLRGSPFDAQVNVSAQIGRASCRERVEDVVGVESRSAKETEKHWHV